MHTCRHTLTHGIIIVPLSLKTYSKQLPDELVKPSKYGSESCIFKNYLIMVIKIINNVPIISLHFSSFNYVWFSSATDKRAAFFGLR